LIAQLLGRDGNAAALALIKAAKKDAVKEEK